MHLIRIVVLLYTEREYTNIKYILYILYIIVYTTIQYNYVYTWYELG